MTLEEQPLEANLSEEQVSEVTSSEEAKPALETPVGELATEVLPAVEIPVEERPTEAKPLALIVDDDATLGETFAAALELVGFETEVLQDSRLAIERMTARKPVLVSLDMQMPHVSGVEVLRMIRAQERFADVKVIMVTANGRVAEEEGILQLADIILIKPITFSQIRTLASRLIT